MADAAVAAGGPRFEELTVENAREMARQWTRHLGGSGPAVEQVTDLQVPVQHGSIPARLYVPAGPLKALIVYFHGGGWVLGSVDEFDFLGRNVAQGAACAVLSVEYRLAPEHPFPAGLEDCVDSVAWASAQLESLLGRNLPLVVMGDSAGGNLAAAVAQQARDAGRSHIAAQVLIYPNVDCDPTTGSFLEFWDCPLFAGRSMQWFWSRYVTDPRKLLLPEVSPLRATNFAGLPPTIVVTAEHDPVRDGAEAYAAALRAAGVRVISYRMEGLSHGFFSMLTVFDEPRRVVERIAGELEQLLAADPAAAQPHSRPLSPDRR
jgi:acetyl esterase